MAPEGRGTATGGWQGSLAEDERSRLSEALQAQPIQPLEVDEDIVHGNGLQNRK